jgi:phosphatidylserine decarboxylase
MKLKKILFLILASISIYKITVSNPKYSITRIISLMAGVVSNITIPSRFRETFFWILIKKYGMIREDMTLPLKDYTTLQEFFTREVKKRNILYSPEKLLAPCDAKVLSFSEVTNDDVFLIKGVNYSLCEFYSGKKKCVYNQEEIQKLKKNPNNKLLSIVFYLSPGDYHRYHAPFDFSISKSIYIPGSLYGVDETTLAYITGVYENNERVILEGSSHLGNTKIGIVGALNVGSIVLNFNKQLQTNSFAADFKIHETNYSDLEKKAGDELGYFRLGSTIVLLTEVTQDFKLNLEFGKKVRYGDVIGA